MHDPRCRTGRGLDCRECVPTLRSFALPCPAPSPVVHTMTSPESRARVGCFPPNRGGTRDNSVPLVEVRGDLLAELPDQPGEQLPVGQIRRRKLSRIRIPE